MDDRRKDQAERIVKRYAHLIEMQTGKAVRPYRLVKETCPKCGKEARTFEMYGTRDYYGIPFRRVCAKCYERIMTTTGYDGVKYDERDENLDADY